MESYPALVLSELLLAEKDGVCARTVVGIRKVLLFVDDFLILCNAGKCRPEMSSSRCSGTSPLPRTRRLLMRFPRTATKDYRI